MSQKFDVRKKQVTKSILSERDPLSEDLII